MRRMFVSALSAGLTFAGASVAMAAPSGPHPRLFLDAPTLSTLKTQASDPTKGAAMAVARCNSAASNPNGEEWGFGWAYSAASCALAYQISGDAQYAQKGMIFVNALLDDFHKIGDGLGGDDVVTHDTGYFMRVYAPYSAIAYDWLHDAPGMTESLRAKMRGRFAKWIEWYSTKGYLKNMAGANYQAGYAFSAAMIAIAEGGEADATGDAHWSLVTDSIFGTDIENGTKPGGALTSGDWAEGWQYGPLSVLEYGLAAKALKQQGKSYPGLDKYLSDLVPRYLHGATPATHALYLGGDTSHDWHYADPNGRILYAALAGTASEEANALARAELAARGIKDKESPVFQALAEANVGPSTPMPADAPTSFVTDGTQTLYVRSNWTSDATWGVFTSSPRLVDDHQHADAGNWVFTRGADDLVVDPSPYSSLSSLTSNAPAIDSGSVPNYQTPSQGWFQKNNATKLAWARQLPSGAMIARADYAASFTGTHDTPSDVPLATRDFIFLPSGGDGTIVLFDRVQTAGASRGAHFRVRTPAKLSISGDVATGTVGGSTLTVRKVFSTSGSFSQSTPSVKDDCYDVDWGVCTYARFAVNDLKLDVSGPSASSLLVVDGSAVGAAAPGATSLTGSGYHGVLLSRSGGETAVITADVANGVPPSSLSYEVPAGAKITHVVVDAPRGASGKSNVSASLSGSTCKVTVTPSEGDSGLTGDPLAIVLDGSCKVQDAGTATQTPDDGAGGTAGAGGTSGDGGAAGVGGSGGSDAGTSGDGGTAGAGGDSEGGSAGSRITGCSPAGCVEGDADQSVGKSASSPVRIIDSLSPYNVHKLP